MWVPTNSRPPLEHSLGGMGQCSRSGFFCTLRVPKCSGNNFTHTAVACAALANEDEWGSAVAGKRPNSLRQDVSATFCVPMGALEAQGPLIMNTHASNCENAGPQSPPAPISCARSRCSPARRPIWLAKHTFASGNFARSHIHWRFLAPVSIDCGPWWRACARRFFCTCARPDVSYFGGWSCACMHLRAVGAPGDFFAPASSNCGPWWRAAGAPGDFWYPEASKANIFKRS